MVTTAFQALEYGNGFDTASIAILYSCIHI